jgi:hypothetical protein
MVFSDIFSATCWIMITFLRTPFFCSIACHAKPLDNLLLPTLLYRDRSQSKDAPKSVKVTASYPTLQEALRYQWTALTKRQTKEVNPAIIFTILGGSVCSANVTAMD